MKGLLIAASIFCAWISGVGSHGNANERLGAVVFLVLALIAGYFAWRMA